MLRRGWNARYRSLPNRRVGHCQSGWFNSSTARRPTIEGAHAFPVAGRELRADRSSNQTVPRSVDLLFVQGCELREQRFVVEG
jgi:hypothetical protein